MTGSQAESGAAAATVRRGVNLELMHKIAVATRKGVEGAAYVPAASGGTVSGEDDGSAGPARLKEHELLQYADGKRSGLARREDVQVRLVAAQDMIDRMLFAGRSASASTRVLTSTADTNIGSISIGFPPWTGGSAQFIVGYSGRRYR